MSEACPYCRESISVTNRTECSTCRTPHHADCWQENGGCTIFGCEQAPADDPKIAVGAQDTAVVEQYFLARRGVQTGPFTLAYLQQESARGGISSEDLVWKQGTESWLPWSEMISGSTAPLLDRFHSPKSSMEDDFQPRVMRFGRGYFLLSIGAAFVVAAAFAISEKTAPIGLLIFYATWLISAVPRIRDVGYSGWFVLLSFVPLANIWLSFHLLLAPRNFAFNKCPDLVLKIVIWLLICIIGLTIIVMTIGAIAGKLS